MRCNKILAWQTIRQKRKRKLTKLTEKNFKSENFVIQFFRRFFLIFVEKDHNNEKTAKKMNMKLDGKKFISEQNRQYLSRHPLRTKK